MRNRGENHLRTQAEIHNTQSKIMSEFHLNLLEFSCGYFPGSSDNFDYPRWSLFTTVAQIKIPEFSCNLY